MEWLTTQVFHTSRVMIVATSLFMRAFPRKTSAKRLKYSKPNVIVWLIKVLCHTHDWIIGAATEHLHGHGVKQYEKSEEIYKSITLNQINSTITKYLSNENPLQVIVTTESYKNEKSD